MKVRNLDTAASDTSDARSRLRHWEEASGLNASMCYADGCINTPSVGGRVQRDDPADATWYVIPLCDECGRKKSEDLEVWDSAILVPAEAAGSSRAAHVSVLARRPVAADSFG